MLLPFCLCLIVTVHGQITLTQLPSGGNKKAVVGERVGLTDVTIHYDRPGVKGRDGKIWGQLVPAGFNNLGFGNSVAAPWRAGSNENTTIEFSNDVMIEGQPLKAGTYGLFMAYDSLTPTIIFSKNSTSWGSYYYNETEDALRVKVKTAALPYSVEWLRYEFMDQTENAATVSLLWERKMIPFRIETDYIKDQVASFNKELRSQRGFYWLAWDQAAQWSLQHNTNLEQALQWADSASGPSFGGAGLFQPSATKAQILTKLGRTAEADAIMKKAIPLANMNELHQYGRALLNDKKAAEALAVFKANYAKHPKDLTTIIGMMRGYSATGDYKNALKFAKLAQPLSTSDPYKTIIADAITKLNAGKDVN